MFKFKKKRPVVEAEIGLRYVGNTNEKKMKKALRPSSKDDQLQQLYLRRLRDFAKPISGFLDDPVAVLDAFALQNISGLSGSNTDLRNMKKEMIESSPQLSQQIATFFAEVLLKTNFKEILKVKSAFVNHCSGNSLEDSSRSLPLSESEEDIERKDGRANTNSKDKYQFAAIFTIIAGELEKEAKGKIDFLQAGPSTSRLDLGLDYTNSDHFDAVIEELLRPCDPKTLNVYSALHFLTTLTISGSKEALVNFLKRYQVSDIGMWLTKGNDTPIHAAARSPNSKWAKEATEIIIQFLYENPLEHRQQRRDLINFQDADGNTALHLAVQNQSGQLAQYLLDEDISLSSVQCLYNSNLPSFHILRRKTQTFMEEPASKAYENMTFWSYLADVWLEVPSGTDADDFRNHMDRIWPVVPLLVGLENFLQLILADRALLVSFVGFLSDYGRHSWTYSVTALLVVVSSTLIVLQLAYISGLGNYVQIFKTVLKKFGIVMLIYICFISGFSIAFSIIFPQDRFTTFPSSFFRSVSMMIGRTEFR